MSDSDDLDDFIDLGEIRHPASHLSTWLRRVWQDLWYGGPRPLPGPGPEDPGDDWDDDPVGDQAYPR
jgi:hypothetical protein